MAPPPEAQLSCPGTLYTHLEPHAPLDPPIHDLNHFFSKCEKLVIKDSDLGVDGPEPRIRILDNL